MKLILTSNPSPSLIDSDTIILLATSNLVSLLKVFAPGSFDMIQGELLPVQSSHILEDKEAWRLMFAILKEQGTLDLEMQD